MAYVTRFSLIRGFPSIYLDFVFDQERLLFFFCVSWISRTVFFYRRSYIRGDRSQDRFFLLLFAFVVSIFILVFRGNFFRVIIGWDGLGVTSFFLVIYFQNKTSLNAGLITILTNRIGDVCLLTTICILLSYSNWDIVFLRTCGRRLRYGCLVVLIVGAFTKSAQIPFSRWLPAAIAAPTPVSSLVHSRTLVTAGVYLLFRFKTSVRESFLTACLLLGGVTICMAGIGGLLEKDFKKIVALSTLRQLGLIVSCLGLGAVQVAFFHLLTHAFFKALLFLAAGRCIHSAHGYQDLRKITLMRKYSTRTKATILTCNFRLIGLPFISGFYSKDLALEIMFSSTIGFGSAILFIWGTLLTVLYATRFIFCVRRGGSKISRCYAKSERNKYFFKSYDRLFFLAVVRGSGLNYFYLKNIPTLFLSLEIKNCVIVLIFFSAIVSLFLSRVLYVQLWKFIFPLWGLGSMWGLTLISPFIGKNPFFWGSLFIEKTTEKWMFKHLFFSAFSYRVRTHANIRMHNSTNMFFRGVFLFTCLIFLI